MSIKTCNICIEEKEECKFCSCNQCGFECCKECLKTFLMSQKDVNPFCMNTECKKVFSTSVLLDIFSFKENNDLRHHSAMMIKNREMSLLPDTVNKMEKRKKIKKLEMDKEYYQRKIHAINYETNEIQDELKGKKKTENNNTYVSGCPTQDCRGFINPQKMEDNKGNEKSVKSCTICNVVVCRKCEVKIDINNMKDHECNNDDLESIKMLKNDTKNCPGCKTPIHKIDGCDQMFCTTCHTPFSWKTGKIETGVIHNPHYYQFMRENNGEVPRNPGDNPLGYDPCGNDRIPNAYDLVKIMKKYMDENTIWIIIRQVHHISRVELQNHTFNNDIDEKTREKYRERFLLKEIDEKKWISLLKNKLKKDQKNKEFHDVIETYCNITKQILRNIHSSNEEEVIKNQIKMLEKLRLYTNSSLKNIGGKYKNKYPTILYNCRYVRCI